MPLLRYRDDGPPIWLFLPLIDLHIIQVSVYTATDTKHMRISLN